MAKKEEAKAEEASGVEEVTPDATPAEKEIEVTPIEPTEEQTEERTEEEPALPS